jgi:cobalt-zinc-cadmium efflux system membrane fusion protein
MGCATQPAHEASEGHHGAEEKALTTYDADAEIGLMTVQCEHGIPILDCSQCRFEAGAVEVPEELLETGEGGGLLRTASVVRASEAGKGTLTGEVAFDETRFVHVVPRLNGVARRVLVELGQLVVAGAPLVELDSLALGQLRSRLLQARARHGLARKTLERERSLHQKRIASESEVLSAEAALEEVRVELAAAEEQLRLLGFSEGEIAGQSTESGGLMVIRAPLAGTVVSKHVALGERVSSETSILTLADLRSVWVWASVYERDLAAFSRANRTGTLPATVRVAAFPGIAFPAQLDYVGSTMDETTRTVKVRAVAPNPEGLLRPGMFAEVEVDLPQASSSLVVPAEAVVADGGTSFVFVRIGSRRFLRRDIVTGERRNGMVEIAAGLSEGEQIIARGAFLMKSDILREKMGAGCAE